MMENIFFSSVLGMLKNKPANPDQEKDSRCCDLGKDASHEDHDGTDEHGRHDGGSASAVAEGSHTNREDALAAGRPMEYTCSSSLPLPTREATKKDSASARRALFVRRHLSASASTSSGASRSPDSGREPSLSCNQSRGPHQSSAPPSPPSPSARPVSSGLNPAASPVRIQTEGSDSPGLPGSPNSRSAQCQTCSPSKDLRPAATLVSHFIPKSPRHAPTSIYNYANHSLLSPVTPSIC